MDEEIQFATKSGKTNGGDFASYVIGEVIPGLPYSKYLRFASFGYIQPCDGGVLLYQRPYWLRRLRVVPLTVTFLTTQEVRELLKESPLLTVFQFWIKVHQKGGPGQILANHFDPRNDFITQITDLVEYQLDV